MLSWPLILPVGGLNVWEEDTDESVLSCRQKSLSSLSLTHFLFNRSFFRVSRKLGPVSWKKTFAVTGGGFLRARYASCCPTSSVKALKGNSDSSAGLLLAVTNIWPPYAIGQVIIFSSVISSSLFFFSSPNLGGRRLDVYHTSTRDVALVPIWNACLKCAARGSLEIQDAKNRHLRTIAQLCRAISSQLRHLSTIGKKLLTRNVGQCPTWWPPSRI